MDVLAEVWLVSDGIEDVVRHVLGVGCGEAHAHVGHALSHLAEEFGKRYAAFHALTGRCQTVAVDVLSEESHLLEATVVQVLHLTQDALHVARTLASTSVRHDAVVAEVVASSHDGYESAHASRSDALRNDIAISLRSAQFDVAGVVSVLALCNHVGQIEVRVGSAYEVGVMVVDKVLTHTLRHTSQNAQYQLASLLLLSMQSLQSSVYLVLRILADGAGVEEYGVGVSLVLAQLVASHLHDGSHHLRVCHVHLAAVCLNEKFLHLSEYMYVSCVYNYAKLRKKE